MTVNAVAPGTVLWPESIPAARRRELVRRIPLGRAGRPEDVAQAVRYLAEAPFVTGAVLPVDGGRRLAGRGDGGLPTRPAAPPGGRRWPGGV